MAVAPVTIGTGGAAQQALVTSEIADEFEPSQEPFVAFTR